MLSARNIRVNIGGTAILHGVDFTARPGEVTAIAGPNGSGKTTLLKAVTGEVPSTGDITLNGYDTRTLPPWQLAAMRGVLPQSTVLAFPFTVIEVVRMGLLRGTSGNHDRRAMDALGLVGLADYAGRYYQKLSGGEQQRVQFARVLAQVWQPVENGEPRWILLDEPVASLDIGHQLEVMRLLRDYAQAGGGVVAVMHDLNLTAMFADSMTLISGGRVLAHGTAEAVMTDVNLSRAYNCPLRVNHVPDNVSTFLHPAGATG
ncbi:heme ABC transporter ATP-binding protein [Amaricoccus tamworthensis]|uniref:heme ABC transporter ATP-binding protein n=1 Tax=Amaricoccus tamworthensis TaxID=57002 RepID=UPI003C7EBD91